MTGRGSILVGQILSGGIGLIFREQPTLEFLQRAFPVGTVIDIMPAAEKVGDDNPPR